MAIAATDARFGHMQRWPPGTPYHAIAADVGRTLGTPELGGCDLVIDRIGVGRAASGLFSGMAATVRSVVISGGHAVNYGEDGSIHVPKKELVASRLPPAQTLVCEMQSFRATITPAGAGSELAWREREHDDLVLAVAVAA
jgi:hypothetical protein